jgi:hypothetical protein
MQPGVCRVISENEARGEGSVAMEAFEHIVKVYLEAREYVVTGGVKFPITRPVKKEGRAESQTHGYEVDIVGIRNESMVLGSVKSFFGSRGVNRQGFCGIADETKRQYYPEYRMFNDPAVREGIVAGACERYGFSANQVQLYLFVGKFHRKDEPVVREHLSGLRTAGSPVKVVSFAEMIGTLLNLAAHRTYINDPVIVTLKALMHAGKLKPEDTAEALREQGLAT